MPRCKDRPMRLDLEIWAEVLQIFADHRTPQAKAAAKLTRQAERVKVKAKIERDKTKPKDKQPKATGRVR